MWIHLRYHGCLLSGNADALAQVQVSLSKLTSGWEA